ncbi:MAG: hypothetical protein HY645_01285 [Acidobacteria bacterium]|nr:hypothetical protein [Acidobacteriota bacterium]
MNRAFLIIFGSALAVAAMFYVLIQNAERATHIHFMSRGGVLTKVIYYSEKPPQGTEHACDGNFAEMPDHLYEAQLERWEDQYGKGD